jgi:hypothetical protein
MSVALAAEAQYGNIAALDQGQVGVIVVKHLCRHLGLPWYVVLVKVNARGLFRANCLEPLAALVPVSKRTVPTAQRNKAGLDELTDPVWFEQLKQGV